MPRLTPLDQLAAALVRGHERAKKSALGKWDAIDEAASELDSLATRVRPHRDRVLADLELFAQSFLPSGFAMEVRTHLREAAPWETWTRTVHPFVVELRYSPSMENQQRESYNLVIDRVAKEDDEWRIVSFYDDATRARAQRESEMLAKARAR